MNYPGEILRKNLTHIQLGQRHEKVVLFGQHAQIIEGNRVEILFNKLRHSEF